MPIKGTPDLLHALARFFSSFLWLFLIEKDTSLEVTSLPNGIKSSCRSNNYWKRGWERERERELLLTTGLQHVSSCMPGLDAEIASALSFPRRVVSEPLTREWLCLKCWGFSAYNGIQSPCGKKKKRLLAQKQVAYLKVVLFKWSTVHHNPGDLGCLPQILSVTLSS